MKKFRVSMNEEVGGYAIIEAKSAKAAIAKAQKIIDEDGVAGFEGFDSTHRDTHIFDAEETA